MSASWADATRIVDERRAARQAKADEAEAVVRNVIPMVTKFRAAFGTHADSDMLRWVATGEWKSHSGKKAALTFVNGYEPEHGRTFKLDLDTESWSIDSIVKVEREKVTIGSGGKTLLAFTDFDDVIEAVSRIPTWLPALLVQTLQENEVPVPTD